MFSSPRVRYWSQIRTQLHLQPPTLPSSQRSFRSARRYATLRPSLSLFTNSATSLSLAIVSPALSPSMKLSSRPRHSASCSVTAAQRRWYIAGGLNSRSATSCSACFARHCRSIARNDSRRDCVLSLWCSTCASRALSCSASAMFWARSACSGAFEAGSEGCVVSGSCMIAC